MLSALQRLRHSGGAIPARARTLATTNRDFHFSGSFCIATHRSNCCPAVQSDCRCADFLSNLTSSSAFAVSLASGAWECSARFKLASTGLDFPQIPAAFSDDAHAREAIMQASLVRAAQSRSRNSFDAVIYVGDGVWDARAARNLGFRFIGISHEPARVERLYAEGAHHVFADYLDADSFMAVLHESNHVA